MCSHFGNSFPTAISPSCEYFVLLSGQWLSSRRNCPSQVWCCPTGFRCAFPASKSRVTSMSTIPIAAFCIGPRKALTRLRPGDERSVVHFNCRIRIQNHQNWQTRVTFGLKSLNWQGFPCLTGNRPANARRGQRVWSLHCA